jgi:hypothetical protein
MNYGDITEKTRLGNTETMASSAFRRLVGEQSEGNGNYQTISEAANIIRESIRTSERKGQEAWDKKSFLRQLRKSAIKNNVWIKDINTIALKAISEGTEHIVYISKDRKSVIKFNSLGRVETPNDFNTLIDRFIAHNEVFPNTAYSIEGFALDDMGNISMLLQQPYIESTIITTQSEIDDFLKNCGFKKTSKIQRGRPIWTNNNYEISDVVPLNVIKDIDGNLCFIDPDINIAADNNNDFHITDSGYGV